MKLKRKLLGMAASVATMTVILSTVSRAQAGSGQPGVAALLSAVNSADAEMKALAAEKVTQQDVRLVNVATIANDGNRATIARAIAKNAGPIGEMREALQKNAAVMAALRAAGVSVNQVVGVDVEHGVAIDIFYQ
jgi:aminoglycoside/choline kinase family phosphotransferase